MFQAMNIMSVEKTTAKDFAGDVLCMLLTASMTTKTTTKKTL